MPLGTPVEQTEKLIQLIEQKANELEISLLGDEGKGKIFRHIFSVIGDQPFAAARAQNAGAGGGQNQSSHLGEVMIELAPSETRGDFGSDELATKWQALVGDIPNGVELTFSASLFSAGDDVNLQLTGKHLDQLEAASEFIKEKLGAYPAVLTTADSFKQGKKEVKLSIKPLGEMMGLSQIDIARQVRNAFYGAEAKRIQRGSNDLRVMVRYPKEERHSLSNLEQMWIHTPSGQFAALTDVAYTDIGRGYASISRTDRSRSINVTADLNEKITTANEMKESIQQNLLPELKERFPLVNVSFEGQNADQADTMNSLKRGFALALIIIYSLLAIPLKSYLQPVVIMTAIPFGLVGALWGHVLLGLNLTILSLFGIVALSGVVVNDSLVLVDFINRAVKQGSKLKDAIIESGVVRFRPIILTSVTTFVGLLPLLLEKSVQAQFLIPMAVSLAFGVLFSTMITLVIVPVSYSLITRKNEQ